MRNLERKKLPRKLPLYIDESWRVIEDSIQFDDADDGSDADDAGGSEPPPERKKKRGREKLRPDEAIALAAYRHATTQDHRRLLDGRRSLAVVVEVPSPGWVAPMARHFRNLKHEWRVYDRDGSSRTNHKCSVGNAEVCRDLGAGRRVAGIAANPATVLPSALSKAADINIRIQALTAPVVREAIGLCLIGRVPDIDDTVVAGLDIDDVLSALRRGSTAKEAVGRLTAAAAQHANLAVTNAPLLETAVEYGEARIWGLSLARDIAEYKAGRLSWGDLDRGAVFYSPPGVGKSVMAASIANACGIPLIRTSVAALFAGGEGDLGAVIKALRAVFAEAAARAPCILFIDEIDAIPNRETMSPRGRDWWTPVCNEVLLLLDNAVGGREGIVVLGATNLIQAVDPALLRPGRLERAIELRHPDEAGIINITRFHLRGELLTDDLTGIAALIRGATAAEIMDLVRSARRLARHAGRALSIDDLRTVAIGNAVSEEPEFLHRAAIHESGHAVIGQFHRPGSVVLVSLQGRGTAAAFTRMAAPPTGLFTLDAIERQVIEFFAGSEAERQILGSATTGAGGTDDSDIGAATRLVAALHGSTALAGDPIYLCPATEALQAIRLDPLLRSAVQRHLRELLAQAADLVGRHKAEIVAVAEELVKRRVLSGDDVLAAMKKATLVQREKERDQQMGPMTGKDA